MSFKPLQPISVGDELVEYVMLELPSSVESLLAAGSKVKLMDLSSEKPKIEFEDGSVLEGSYESSLGTIMLYERHAGDLGQTSTNPDASAAQSSVKFKALTETRVVFTSTLAAQPTLPGSNLSKNLSAGPE